MKSISQENLLHLRPILVDENMNVIDGQHRLEAAKRLGVEVYYQVEKSLDNNAIFLLNNNQLKWSSTDYLNFYCSEGNQNYLKIREFMRKNNVPLAIALTFLNGSAHGKYLKGFKEGKFVYPNFETELDGLTKIGQLKEMIDYVFPKILGAKKYLTGPNFSRAFAVFLNVKNVQFEIFMKKLPYKLDVLRPCARIKDFLEVFRAIYNFKNSEPISNDDIKDLN